MARILLMIALIALFRSMPVYLSKDQAIDVSFIIVFATAMYFGPEVAVVAFALSMPFSFERDRDSGKLRSYLSYPLIKILFNSHIVIISVFVSGFVFELTGGIKADFSLPYSLIPSIIFTLFVMVFNLLQLEMLFKLGEGEKRETLARNILGVLPNIAATTPIGILLVALLHQPSGEYIILLFLIPMFLARYSFKLYLDSKDHYYSMIGALSAAIEAKDPYTEGHSRRVEQYATHIARAMHLSSKRIEEIKVASLLHDIGKIGIMDTVLCKAGALDPVEWDLVRKHPEIGYKIVEQISLSETVKSAILHHHERYDGSGYPSGSELASLPIEASILSAADAFDAMTSNRPYRRGMSKEEALSIIIEESGRQFHPEVVFALEKAAPKIQVIS